MKPAIVNLKSFGDFVIACNAVSNLQITGNIIKPTIIAGEHVRSLAKALGINCDILFIGNTGSIDVPSAFDIRKRGLLPGLVSLIKLRNSLRVLPNTELFFDSLGWRELFLGCGRSLNTLPSDCSNIYLAYDDFFKSLGYSTLNKASNIKRTFKKAVIIPGSRLASKIIPPSVISSYVAELGCNNIQVIIGALDGELIDIPGGTDVLKIPRNFDSLLAVIKMADLVISADSLSSHVSEFYNIPVFVSTPTPNPYWLPRSAYLTRGWAEFGGEHYFKDWLKGVTLS